MSIDPASPPDPTARDFGAQLVRWRKAAGLTQQAAAAALGVSISALQKWERGSRAPSRWRGSEPNEILARLEGKFQGPS